MKPEQIQLCRSIVNGELEGCQSLIVSHDNLTFELDAEGFNPALFCLAFMQAKAPMEVIAELKQVLNSNAFEAMTEPDVNKSQVVIKEVIYPIINQDGRGREALTQLLTKLQSQPAQPSDNRGMIWLKWTGATLRFLQANINVVPLREQLNSITKELASVFVSVQGEDKDPITPLPPPLLAKPAAAKPKALNLRMQVLKSNHTAAPKDESGTNSPTPKNPPK